MARIVVCGVNIFVICRDRDLDVAGLALAGLDYTEVGRDFCVALRTPRDLWDVNFVSVLAMLEGRWLRTSWTLQNA